MRFALTDEQIEFRDAVRALLADTCTPDDLRAAWSDPVLAGGGPGGGDGRVRAAYDACLRYLNGVDRKARRRAMLAGMASSIAFSLFAVGVMFLAVLYWRGLF